MDESPLLDLGKTTRIFTGKSTLLSNFINGHVATTRMASSDDVDDEESRVAMEEIAEVRVSLQSADSLDDYDIADYADLAYASDERVDSPDREFDRIQPVMTIPCAVISPSILKQVESIPSEGTIERKLKKKKKKTSSLKEEPKAKDHPIVTKVVPGVNPHKSKLTTAQSIKHPAKDISSPRKQPTHASVASKQPAVNKSRNKEVGVAAPLRASSNPVIRPKSSKEPIFASKSRASEKPSAVILTKSTSGSKEDRLTTKLLRKSLGVVGAIKSETKKGSGKMKITRRSS